MANSIVWVDIPVLNLDRSIKFYSAVIGSPVAKQEYPGMSIGLLPHVEGKGEVSGCLFTSPDAKPSDQGPLIYLNAQGRLDQAVAAGEGNRGERVHTQTPICPHTL